MKKTLFFALLALIFASCTRTRPIVILFDNDVHCAVDGYAKMAGLRDSFSTATPYVSVVSAGDWAQGDVMGSLTEGEAIVRIINAVGYDATTIGNHEFDYSVSKLLSNAAALRTRVLCCNIDGPDGALFAPSYIARYGSTRVGFVGVATPTTFNTSTPTYFQDSLGRVIYNFHMTDTYDCIQHAVDQVRAKGADYIVLLSHLGDDTELAPSPDMIAHTRGIDVVLDGHSHHVFNTRLPNLDGDSVLFASTGTKFMYFGVLTIAADGSMAVDLRPNASVTVSSAEVEKVVLAEKDALAERTNKVVGYTEVNLIDRNTDGERIVRWTQTNMGLFLCNAWRYVTGAEIALMNGGGVRAGIPAGDITMGQIMSVLPFNNRIWKMTATGQQILDALEVGVMTYPVENGDFPQSAGIRYRIHPNIPSSVVMDDNHLFLSVGASRRIFAVEVENADGSWSSIDPARTYTVAGQSYIMLNSGASGMFRYFQPAEGPLMTDVEAVVDYLHSLHDTVPATLYY